MDTKTIQTARDALKSAPNGVYAQKVVPKEPVKQFYSNSNTGVADVFEQSANEGYQALFMPELALARIGSQDLWQNWYVTPSVRATGQTKAGAKVVVYAHVPNYLSNPANIRNTIKEGTLKNGAGAIPQDQFDALVSQNGNGRVFVIDYDTLRKSSSEVISVDSALEHPQTIPFLGSEATAKLYLQRHKEVYGKNIGIWHQDDFDKKTPRGRVLFLGGIGYDGLGGVSSLGVLGGLGGGRVLGVAPEAQSVEKNSVPATLESKVELLHNGKALRHEGKTYILAPEGLEL